MKRIFLLILLTINIINVIAQKGWVKGNLVTIKNDTLVGEILKGDKPLIWNVKFKFPDGNINTYEAKELREVITKSESYDALFETSGFYLYKRITVGGINLYQKKNKIYVQADEKKAIGISNRNLQKVIIPLLEKHDETIRKISDPNIKLEDIPSILTDYNEWWYKKNGGDVKYGRQDILIANPVVEKKYINDDSIIRFLSPAFLKLSLIGVGAEIKLSKQTTFFTQLGGNFYWYQVKSGGRTKSEVGIVPFIFAQPRFYLNLKERIRKGKYTNNFSGNYFGPFFLNYSYPVEIIGFGTALGSQYQKGRLFYYGFDVGAGLGKDYVNSDLKPFILLKFNVGLAPKYGFVKKVIKGN